MLCVAKLRTGQAERSRRLPCAVFRSLYELEKLTVCKQWLHQKTEEIRWVGQHFNLVGLGLDVFIDGQCKRGS
jgi:hypothetical protein